MFWNQRCSKYQKCKYKYKYEYQTHKYEYKYKYLGHKYKYKYKYSKFKIKYNQSIIAQQLANHSGWLDTKKIFASKIDIGLYEKLLQYPLQCLLKKPKSSSALSDRPSQF